MTVSFYDNDRTGKLHMRALAGGGGSEWDAPATAADIAAHPEAMSRYQADKRKVLSPPEPSAGDRLAAIEAEANAKFAEVQAENEKLQAELDAARAALNPKPAD